MYIITGYIRDIFKRIFNKNINKMGKDQNVSNFIYSELFNKFVLAASLALGFTIYRYYRLRKTKSKLELELQQCNGQIEKLKELARDYSTRLATEIGNKIASDESAIENINIVNRPMNVADNYSLFCSNEWLDAKTCLDQVCKDLNNSTIMQFLSCGLMIAVEEAGKYKNLVFSVITEPMLNHDSHVRQQDHSSLPKELTNVVYDYLRNHSAENDVGPLVNKIVARLSTDFSQVWERVKSEAAVNIYLTSAAKIAWDMVIQRPPMHFQSCEKWKGTQYMELCWGSNVQPHEINHSSTALYTVYPMLYHKQQLMVKGKVLAVKENP